MLNRSAVLGLAIAVAMVATQSGGFAFDPAMYPNLKGQWFGVRGTAGGGQPSFDPVKRWGTTQDAPLTPEYEAMFKANLEDQRAGGQGTNATSTCLAPGMPMVMNAHSPMQIIVLPETTYIRIDHIHDSHRRIYTDGRDWPEEVEPAYVGYSLGKWRDEDGDGRFDVLEVETRHIRGPRAYDATGLPLHRDNRTVVKERIYLDKANPNILRDEITVIDDALTRPWVVTKSYRRSPNPRPEWQEYACAESNNHVRIGTESYFLSADGYLMPAKRDQPPPDLRYFNRTKK